MQRIPVNQARLMLENRKMRFEEAYGGLEQGQLRQTEAALLLGKCERSFRRHVVNTTWKSHARRARWLTPSASR